MNRCSSEAEHEGYHGADTHPSLPPVVELTNVFV
jgi:hypothetical protein